MKTFSHLLEKFASVPRRNKSISTKIYQQGGIQPRQDCTTSKKKTSAWKANRDRLLALPYRSNLTLRILTFSSIFWNTLAVCALMCSVKQCSSFMEWPARTTP